MFNFKSNSLEISKLNIKCMCEYCNEEISRGTYHFVINLHFKYYGYKSINFHEKKKKKVIGTIRLHLNCLTAMVDELIKVNEELEKLKVDLFTKELMK